MKKVLIITGVVLFLIPTALVGQNLKIEFSKTTYEPGDMVKATITTNHSGPLGVHNGISLSSIQLENDKLTDLGRVEGPGIYPLIFFSGGITKSYTLLVFPDAKGQASQYDAQMFTDGEFERSVFEKFVDGLTEANLSAAAKKTVLEYLPNNAMSATTTIIVCGAMLNGLPTMSMCVNGVADEAITFTFEFMQNLLSEMKRSGALSNKEYNDLRNVLIVGEGIQGIYKGLFRADALEIFLSSSNMATDLIVDNKDIKLLLGLGDQQIKQFATIIKINK